MKRILITLLMSCGLLIGCSEQKNESIKTQRAIPQVQARNNSITPSDNYVLATGQYSTIRKLESDSIIYMKNDVSSGWVTNIKSWRDTFYIVLENNYFKTDDTPYFCIYLQFTGPVTCQSNSEDFSVEAFNPDADYTINTRWRITLTKENYDFAIFEVKGNSDNGMNPIFTISKVSDTNTINRIYSNVLSANPVQYDIYVGVGVSTSNWEPEFSYRYDDYSALAANYVQKYQGGISIPESQQLNIRIVNSNEIDDSVPYDDYSGNVNLDISIPEREFETSDTIPIFVKNDSKYRITINHGEQILPGYADTLTISRENEEMIINHSTRSSFENLNVENGDRIFVTGITQDYVNKMQTYGSDFAFRIDWEKNVNKRFQMAISKDSMYTIPIRKTDWETVTLVQDKTYDISITWEDNQSTITIDEVTK